MRRSPLLLALSLAAWGATACGAAPAQGTEAFTGRVVRVLDGDSMRVLRDGREVEVRLHGVDAPEGGQAFGSDARRFLSSLVLGETVSATVVEVDAYGRLVVHMAVAETDVALEIIRAGCGWHYTRYSDDARYAAAERDARQARLGLWKDAAPVAPWEFRQRARTEAGPSAAPTTASGPFHGNVVSHVFHAPGCEQYACRNCTAVFATAEAAVAAGYRPHQECVRRGP